MINQIKVDGVVHDINDKRTAAQLKTFLGIKDGIETTITLGTSWTGSSAPFSQEVALSGLLATDKPILDVQLDLSKYDDQETEWLKIIKAESSVDKLKFYAKEKTTQSLAITVKVVR